MEETVPERVGKRKFDEKWPKTAFLGQYRLDFTAYSLKIRISLPFFNFFPVGR